MRLESEVGGSWQGAMSSFSEDFPADCPPADAVDANGRFFRVVKKDPCAEEDFRTQGELGKAQGACPCLRAGLSVLKDYGSARHYRDKYPHLGCRIASATLAPAHGKTLSGDKGHVTWWSYDHVIRHSLFLVKEEGS